MDFKSINTSIKQWLYRDLPLKPEVLVLHRHTNQGGLGLYDVKLKAKASFVRCFIEFAANPKYLNSNYLNSIYRKEILGEDLITHVVTPSYIDRDTLEDIIDAKEKGVECSHWIRPDQVTISLRTFW